MKKKNHTKPDLDIDKLYSYNWLYNLDYDYDRSHNCSEHGCDDEGICRCGVIESTTINSVDIDAIAREICGTNRILNYCVNRILNHSKMRETSSWNLSTCGGYYGEEIEGVEIDKTAIPGDKLKELLAHKDSNTDMIKIALVNEYAYVLPELEKVTDFEIIKVPLESISIGQEAYYKKLDRTIIKRYSGFDLPLGICMPINDKFRLIDGYHRIAAAKVDGKRVVEIIVGKVE